ncbi:MAG: hypothetical protein AAFV07_01165 [Bacteroidota bacterium]
MNYRISILFCLLWSTCSLLAQQESTSLPFQNQVRIQVGLDRTLVKDQVFAPLNFKGSGLALSSTYLRQTKNEHLSVATLQFALSAVKARPSDFSASRSINGHLDLAHFRKIKWANEKLNLFVGGAVSADISLIDFDEFEAFSFTNLYAIGPAALLTWQPASAHQVSLRADFPLLGILVRPAYTGWDNEFFEKSTLRLFFEGPLATVVDFSRASVQMNYAFTVSSGMSLSFQHQMSYLAAKEPGPARNFHSLTTIGTQFNF